MDFTEQRLPPNPAEKANFLSKLFFIWIMPLFKKGYSKDLEVEDLYDVLKGDQAKHLGDKLERYWEMELEKAKQTGKKPSLTKALIKVSWKTFAGVSIVYCINQCIFMTSQPFLLRLLIVTFNEKDAEMWKKWTYAGTLCAVVFLTTISIHPVVFKIMLLGMKLRVAISSLIYRKALKLSKSAQNKTNAGQIVNLLSNDCTRFDLNLNFLPFLISAPIVFVTMMYLLYDQIGLACLAGVAFIVFLLPMQYYIGKYSAIFRLKIAKRTDERGKVMNELIGGMRVIKMYAWEKPFSILIDGIRKLEVVELRKRGHLRGLHQALINFSSRLVQYLTLLAFFLMEDEPMTSDKVFFTLASLHTVCQILIHFTPQAAAGIGEMYVAINRVQEFLMLDEQKSNNFLLYNAPPISSDKTKEVEVKDQNENKSNNNCVRIAMKNVCANWTENRITLDNISFSLGDDKLMMVVGPVGSSKTSLLHAIIDELPLSSGTLSINGTISYASQESWIFAGNLQQNILFGLPYDEERYNDTVRACALIEDLKQLPYGDMTVVGERGVALSGGQKARVNLARALYRQADIYLMDDPLSAVDTRVSRHLFEKCIKEHLRGSTRILVTHQLQYLPQADHIIILSQGKILAQGSYEQLIDAGIDFVGLMTSAEEESAAKRLSSASIKSQEENKEEKKVEKGKPEENKEKKSEGAITARTYWEYFTAGHSVFGFFALVISLSISQVFMSSNDWWLSYWTNSEAKKLDLDNNVTDCSDPSDKACKDTYLGAYVYLYTYTGLTASVVISNLIRGLWFYMYCAVISVSIHDKMFRSMVRAPIKFFDDNPSGRIMNRFTKDVGTLDELLPPAFIDTIVIFLQVFGVICIVIISNYYLGVPTVILFIILYFMRRVFVQTARDIKRIESIMKSPCFTHVTATLQGLTTVRACNAQQELINQFEGLQDLHSASFFIFLGANRCFGMWLELVSDLFLTIVTFSFILISTSDQGGNVGLAISSLLSLMGAFQWGMRQSAETENFMTSVERALEYSKLEPEAELKSKPDVEPPLEWPQSGQIEFCDMSLSYEKGKPVLKNLSFNILPSEKIGIVGRTGAGKSSIINALFRLTEPEGEILIDNIKVNLIGLHDLRKRLSIIPQDPVLFSGSVRYNLDPFNQFNDSDLWRALEEVELKNAVPSLDYHVDDGGANFSVGQRQLVCLARAILRRSKIILLDEATANIDMRTDDLIQQTIRSRFSECTVITVAHRIHTIIECDRILVLDHGVLKEYDHPHLLLQNEAGVFTGMVQQTGQSTSALLKKQAEKAYRNKHLPKNEMKG